MKRRFEVIVETAGGEVSESLVRRLEQALFDAPWLIRSFKIRELEPEESRYATMCSNDGTSGAHSG